MQFRQVSLQSREQSAEQQGEGLEEQREALAQPPKLFSTNLTPHTLHSVGAQLLEELTPSMVLSPEFRHFSLHTLSTDKLVGPTALTTTYSLTTPKSLLPTGFLL